jgi:putative transposase
MHSIDRVYTDNPTYGSRRITAVLNSENMPVSVKKVRKMMSFMGLRAIYPKPNLSKPSAEHKVYPYLLRDKKIEKPNEVWACDITYIPMKQGFMYCFAVIDWYSRSLLSWEISNSLEVSFCIKGLKKALQKFGKPEIFNSDQGSQFTSLAFTAVLLENDIKISMDGKGRATDNAVIERFWRSLKYEHIYLHAPETVSELYLGVEKYIEHYNCKRPHQSLNYRTPKEVYGQSAAKKKTIVEPSKG